MEKLRLKIIAISIVLLSSSSLLSCASDEDSTNQSGLDRMQFEAYYQNTVNTYHQGSSYAIEIRSELGALTATNQGGYNDRKIEALEKYQDVIQEMEETYETLILEIHEEKRKTLGALKCQSSFKDIEENGYSTYPSAIPAAEFGADVPDFFNSKDIQSKIVRFRDQMANRIASSHVRHSDSGVGFDNRWKLGSIGRDELKEDGSDEKYFYGLMEKVNPDDPELIMDLLLLSTPRKGENRVYSAKEALHYLCIQEARILRVRTLALMSLKSRVSTGMYSFDRVLPLAYGPSSASPGDEIEVVVMMAAFDSQNNPEVTCAQPADITIHDGKAHIKLKVDETTTLNGTISVMDKTGRVKTQKWETEIIVE